MAANYTAPDGTRYYARRIAGYYRITVNGRQTEFRALHHSGGPWFVRHTRRGKPKGVPWNQKFTTAASLLAFIAAQQKQLRLCTHSPPSQPAARSDVRAPGGGETNNAH